MAGIYIHIPFCKQACIYCDFHFSTTHKNKSVLLSCIKMELALRREVLKNESISTIYFGGGTPSLCTTIELSNILDEIYNNFSVHSLCEITLEANPDDLNLERIKELNSIGINRISVGVQSFFEEDLRWMNRAHNAHQAKSCLIDLFEGGISNVSVDLIFGTPLLTDKKLEANLNILMSLKIPHLSCYSLTIEEKTLLHHQIKTKKIAAVTDETSSRQFYYIRTYLQQCGYDHYEISNYAMPGYYSKHNTAYWQRIKYLGVGPSAHSFTGLQRNWNVRNNESYIRSLSKNELVYESETLTQNNIFNEILLTGLRTQWGVSLDKLKTDFKVQYFAVEATIDAMLETKKLMLKDDRLTLMSNYLILSDSIASELFII